MFYNINRINWTGCLTFPIDFINCIDINDVEEVIDSIAQNVLENIHIHFLNGCHASLDTFDKVQRKPIISKNLYFRLETHKQ